MSEKKKKTKTTTGKTGKTAGEVSGGTGGTGGNPMDLGLLEKMVKLMSQHDLSTVDVRDGAKRIVLRRGAQYVTGGSVVHSAPVAAVASQASGTSTPVSAPTAPVAGDSGGAGSSDTGLVPVKSPMVGTFYSSPSPDAKSFVSVGTAVDEDTDVCVIEAMKVFNNIKAETRGTIAKVLVTNGSTVEFGQVLFLVKP